MHNAQELDYLANEVNQILGSSEEEMPIWSKEPERMVIDVEARYLGPIKSDDELKAVEDRLKYLRSYSPTLAGNLKSRCDHTITILEGRVTEWKGSNLAQLISSISDFVDRPIQTDEDLNSATGYIQDLIARRRGLTGSWARSIDEYISRLKGRISEYREKLVKPTKLGTQLGAPDEVTPPTPKPVAEALEPIPDILKPLWIKVYPPFVAIGKPGPASYIHTIDSKYGRFEEIVAGEQWKVGFEDLDDKYFTPDYDYDEPELICTLKDPTHLEIAITGYGTFALNASSADLYYGDKMLVSGIGGGAIPWHVGDKFTVEVTAVPVTPITPVTEATWFDKLKSWLPYLVAFAAIGGTIAIVAKKAK